MPVVAIDTETTGLNSSDSAIIQVGIAWRDDVQVNTWSDFCNPGVGYFANGKADVALAKNKIPLSTIRKSKAPRVVSKKLWSQLQSIEESAREPIELRAFNRPFDAGFLAKEPWGIPSHMWGPCVMEAVQNHFRLPYRLRAYPSRPVDLHVIIAQVR